MAPLPEGVGSSLVLWSVRTLSFFTTINLLWLGLTVLLNVDRRSVGTWLAGGGLLLGALFFAGHSILIGYEPGRFVAELGLLWPLICWLLIGAPYLWLLVMTWYSNQLRTRLGLILFAGGTIGFLALAVRLLVEPPLNVSEALSGAAFAVSGPSPLLLSAYVGYSILCIALSLIALGRPSAADRLMGELARQRAKPWLVVTSVALLLLSLSVAAFAVWFLQTMRAEPSAVGSSEIFGRLLLLDLAVSAEAAVAVVLMGQAIGSYEVFTGRVLPRRGLLRHWRRNLCLAAGYGALIAASLALPLHPIYQVMLSLFVVTLFHALITWRLFVERDRSMAQFRPLVSGEHLYERLLGSDRPAFDVALPFATLCKDLLSTEFACLVPLGPMTSLIHEPLVHPPSAQPPTRLLRTMDWTPDLTCVPLEPDRYERARWAVPLWSERGLIGALLLDDKKDGGLYVQEEMEVARSIGERLMDALATAELSERLVKLQRQRLAEQQVLDQRTRRVLHDDVLPQLQTAVLKLNAGGDRSIEQTGETTALLTTVHRQIAALLRELPAPFSTEIAKLGMLEALRREIDIELGSAFEEITWRTDDQAEQASKALPSLSSDVLFAAAREVARNAAHHGRSDDLQRPLRLLVAATWRDGLELTLTDNGVGLAAGHAAGNGRGLELYSTLLSVIGGSLTVENIASGAKVVLRVPVQEG